MGQYSYLEEPTRNDSLAIPASNTLVAESRNQDNPRKALVVRNISPNAADTISITLGFNVAVANKGIVLRQYESFTDATDSGYQCWQGAITAICATANGLLSIFER